LFAVAQWMERTAVGWLVLDETGSIFLTALAWAVRSAPGTVLGPFAGALADRHSRPLMLAAGSALKLAAVLGMGALALNGDPPVVLILILIAVSGASMTLNVSALQPLVRDVVGAELTMNAISLNSFGQRAIGAVGAILAGVLIGSVGAGWTFLVAGGVLTVSAVGFVKLRTATRTSEQSQSFTRDLIDGLRLMVSVPMVAILLGLMILVENFGFSFNAILPAVADGVYNVGPEGLGALGTALGAGSILGTVGLAVLGDYRHKGVLLAGVVAAFGLLLVAIAGTSMFVLGLLIAAGLGAAMAAVDALEWILLQASVPDEYRGRAIGAWNLAIGLGWLGPIVLGAAAEQFGLQRALAVAGVLLVMTGFLSLRSSGLRRA
jgi:MFS family permease